MMNNFTLVLEISREFALSHIGVIQYELQRLNMKMKRNVKCESCI